MCLLRLFVIAASSPDTVVVHPGDTLVKGAELVPYEVVWVQYFDTDRSRRLRRTIVDRLERESREGSDRLVRTQTFLDLDGETTSSRTNRVHGATLALFAERWRFRGRVTHVDYDARRVRGAMIDSSGGSATSNFDKRLPRAGFDFNVMPQLLAALDLEPDLTLRIPHVRISPPAVPEPEIAWATMAVERREEVEAGPLGRVQAWRVVDREHDMAFWLIEDAPYLVRMSFPIDETTLSVMELGAVRDGDGSDTPFR